MPNMEELSKQVSSELSQNDLDATWTSVTDLDYSYGQMQFCNQGGFYGPADIPTIFQEKIDRTFGHQTPVWLDDISVVARATKEQHTQKLESLLRNLENEGYSARKTKSKFYQKRQ